MFERLADKEGQWVIYNQHTDLQFAECSICGYEDNDQLFINLMVEQGPGSCIVMRCPKCEARITSWALAEEEQ